MTNLTEKREQATPGATSHNMTQRLRALAERPRALTVHELIDRYMAQYAGRDGTRGQRLAAWLAMIGDFTLEQVDSDLVHAGRSELASKPPLVFVGLDHLGQQIFRVKSRAKLKTGSTLNRYTQALAAVFEPQDAQLGDAAQKYPGQGRLLPVGRRRCMVNILRVQQRQPDIGVRQGRPATKPQPLVILAASWASSRVFNPALAMSGMGLAPLRLKTGTGLRLGSADPSADRCNAASTILAK